MNAPTPSSLPEPAEPALADSLGLHRYRWTRPKLAVVASALALIVCGGVVGMTEPAPQAAPQIAHASPQPAQPVARSGGVVPALPGDALAPGTQSLTPTGGFTDTRRRPGTEGLTAGDGVEVAPPSPLPSAEPLPAQPSAAAADGAPIAWSGPMLRGGFGMLVGFLIGFAVRAFIRLASVIAGVYLLSLTVLSYFGWITVHWGVIEAQVVPALGSLGAELHSFKTFLAGSLPTAGLAGVGLATGLKQK